MSVADALYREMVSSGLNVEAHDGALHVSPTGQITDALRAKIRAHKADLLALLSGTDPPPLTPAEKEAIGESIAERAAIKEFDGGESREVAEHQAAAAMRVYRYRLTDRREVWLTMLAPECNPGEARHALELRFGPDRLSEIREQPR